MKEGRGRAARREKASSLALERKGRAQGLELKDRRASATNPARWDVAPAVEPRLRRGFERQAFASPRRREGSGQLSLNMPPFKAFDVMARLCAVACDVDENVPRKSAAVRMTCLRPLGMSQAGLADARPANQSLNRRSGSR
jgi:hypothetical protein